MSTVSLVTQHPCQHSYPLKSYDSGQGCRLLAAKTAFCSQVGDNKEHGTVSANRLAQSDQRLLLWLWKTMGGEHRREHALGHPACWGLDRALWVMCWFLWKAPVSHLVAYHPEWYMGREMAFESLDRVRIKKSICAFRMQSYRYKRSLMPTAGISEYREGILK